MAAHTRLIKITYENDESFKLETKLDDDSYLTVTSMDENGYFSGLWDSGCAPLCKKYFNDMLDVIGAEMKA